MSAPSALGRVITTAQLNPHLVRVELDVPGLTGLDLPYAPDAAVGLYFPAGDEESAREGRTYTVREHDAVNNRIVVDFVMHGRGTGTEWVRRAGPGDAVTLAHARSWYRPPATTDWQVLVADMAGLPALARLIDEQPDIESIAVIEVLDGDDLGYLPDHPAIPVVESVGTGNGGAASVLAALTAEYCRVPGRGYCWFAGEAGEARAVRKYLRHEEHWQSDQVDSIGYWRRDSEDWDERYARVGPRLFSVYERARAAGKSDKDAAEEFDDALERSGL